MAKPTSNVSGLITGLDWETTISQLMAIERRRATLLENRKRDQESKLNLWAQIQGKIASLLSTMQGLDQRSEFAVKSASSSDATVVSASATGTATAGAHTVEVLQLATAHSIAAQGWADKGSTGVGDSGGNLVIQVGDETITIADADLSAATTLEQLRNLINNHADNNGLLTASILDDGSAKNRYRLVLTANSSGTEHRISVISNPTNLNFSTTALDEIETQSPWSGTAAITATGTYAGTLNKTFTFTIAGTGAQTVGATPITIHWVDSVGNNGTLLIPEGYSPGAPIAVAEGVALSFQDGELVGGEAFQLDVFAPELTAAQNARVRIDGIYMNKSSNTITDVLDGVTLNLLAADPGKPVTVTITNDRAAVKAKVQSFVDAYNAAMADIAAFSKYDEENKKAAPLLGDGFLSEIRSRLAAVTATAFRGLPANARFDSLPLIGIRASTKGLLTVDDTKLDKALEEHFDDVVNLFTETFSAGDSKIGFVSSGFRTQSGEYEVVVNYDAAGNITSATIGGYAASVDGMIIHGAQNTPVEGLALYFTAPDSGPGSVNTTIRFGKGAAASIASQAAAISDPDTGPIRFANQTITSSLEALNRQLDLWENRLELVEDRLRRRFSQLETLISQLRSQSNYLSAILK